MQRLLLAAAPFLMGLVSTVALACNVPVFRYALERWPADPYEILVLHEGELDSVAQAQLNTLRKASKQSSSGTVNCTVREVDVKASKDTSLQQLWLEKRPADGKPLMVLMYPRNAREVPDRLVVAKPLTDQAVERLLDSSVRREVAEKLLSGDSAVWIFVPCGDKTQDEIAHRTLTEQAKQNQESLELPPQDEIEADEFFRRETPIELRVGFSVVTLDREDPQEQALLEMLLASEPDLEDLNQPMAFPVIGRGRVLYALVGKGIFQDTIALASRFVVGPCSCQVKDQNPGFDLLMNVDWDEKIGGEVISEEASGERSKPILIQIPPGK